MELKSIKLIGFKSFVDPTTIEIKGNMNSIVGPNGCGKSNVVDAIRWVVGESSAKQLRGQSMADVIFNGTTARKPVGKAAVELVFDNTQGRLTGEYAKYNEISVRREVERDGGSSYYINGLLSRRKDIVDIFLGTGLGPKSYAIIEQGMISRLLEAKPEDNRSHLEEVAGISKYKERRKETEQRIRHTRENLDRLNDLTEEIDKQLRQLKRQSNAAERYKVYKEELRQLQSEILTLRWIDFDDQAKRESLRLDEMKTEYEGQIAQKRAFELSLEKSNEEKETQELYHADVQKEYYTMGSDIVRIEQQLKTHEEQQQRWTMEHEEVTSQINELTSHQSSQQATIHTLTNELTSLSPQNESLREAAMTAQNALDDALNTRKTWQNEYNQTIQSQQALEKSIGILKNTLSHHDSEMMRLQSQRDQLIAEQDASEMNQLQQNITPLEAQVAQLVSKKESMESTIAGFTNKIIEQRSVNKGMSEKLEQGRQALQSAQTQLASLAALQAAALNTDDETSKAWLCEHQLDKLPKLGQSIKVDNGWEFIVESILGHYFDAVCVDTLESVMDLTPSLEQGHVLLLGKGGACAGTSPSLPHRPLLDVVSSDWPLEQWLSGIYIAEDFQQAKALACTLSPAESVITRDGIWLASSWCKVIKATPENDSILLREQELKNVQQTVNERQEQINQCKENQEQGQQVLSELESSKEQSQQSLQDITSELSDNRSRLSADQSRLKILKQQQERVAQSLQHCVGRLESVCQKKETSTVTLNEETEKLSGLDGAVLTLKDQGKMLYQALDAARDKAQEEKQRADEVGIRLSANENQLRVLKQASEREQKQFEQLQKKKDYLSQQLSSTDGPQEQWKLDLQEKLEARVKVEKCLLEAEESLQQLTQSIKKTDREKNEVISTLTKTQESIQKVELEQQTFTVRKTTLLEQLESMSLTLQAVRDNMAEEANLTQWQEQEEVLDRKISRLGPINLAAIDEYKTQSERKEYLDQQHADLMSALEILESAIAKIDKETRTQFKDTFDKVNASFQALFPRIFGGGKASLTLTENDYLTAGVEIMAQPPGKKNSTIHMLSGGEKALTAISLVFAMFEYNPAPFCILDEVDAPLDDVNVGRFCKLVKEMSTKTQFILISHNKVTISMADHLMGVTMHEAGVSRLVSVDMEEAIAMTDT